MSLILESSLSRVLRKTLDQDIAIITAFRSFSEDGDTDSNTIRFGKDKDSKGRRPILFPSYLEGKWAKNVLEANRIANLMMVQELEKLGLYTKQDKNGITSVIGAYQEEGKPHPTVENSFVIESHGEDSERFIEKVLMVASHFNQDCISFLPKVRNMKDSYLFITFGSQGDDGLFHIQGANLGELNRIVPKDMHDKQAKTVVKNKQIEYEVDWNKSYNIAQMKRIIHNRLRGVEESEEEINDAIRRDNLNRELRMMEGRTRYGYKFTDEDRRRMAVIKDVLKNHN